MLETEFTCSKRQHHVRRIVASCLASLPALSSVGAWSPTAARWLMRLKVVDVYLSSLLSLEMNTPMELQHLMAGCPSSTPALGIVGAWGPNATCWSMRHNVITPSCWWRMVPQCNLTVNASCAHGLKIVASCFAPLPTQHCWRRVPQ